MFTNYSDFTNLISKKLRNFTSIDLLFLLNHHQNQQFSFFLQSNPAQLHVLAIIPQILYRLFQPVLVYVVLGDVRRYQRRPIFKQSSLICSRKMLHESVVLHENQRHVSGRLDNSKQLLFFTALHEISKRNNILQCIPCQLHHFLQRGVVNSSELVHVSLAQPSGCGEMNDRHEVVGWRDEPSALEIYELALGCLISVVVFEEDVCRPEISMRSHVSVDFRWFY